ncbi:hypothetical protein G6724_00060 [Polynucleobacter paneuropaeus]|nr:hypothetical protein [Polynucleobacter paneuropaeus]
MVSAYLQIYNDDEFLAESLDSIKNIIDELVVVDGCYEWMREYYTALGFDPSRSNERTYEILENSGIPYTCINNVWKNQLEKRVAGYSACKNRYVMRIDSDEILYFYENGIDAFIAGGNSVAHIDMPELLTSNLFVTGLNNTYPKQCFLFDSDVVSAEDHLHYLWLVLHVDHLTSNRRDLSIHPNSIALNLHATGWRTPQTSLNRASYYTINWMRKNGFPDLPFPENHVGLNDFSHFFSSIMTPSNLRSVLKFDEMIQGRVQLSPDQEINPIPLVYQSAFLDDKYKTFIAALDEISSNIRGETFISGRPIFINIHNSDDLFVRSGRIEHKILGIEGFIIDLRSNEPYCSISSISIGYDGSFFSFEYPRRIPESSVRRVMKLTIWTDAPGSLSFITFDK